MKSASTVAALPIVSVNEGEQVATVNNLLVDRKSKKVEYLSVEPDVKDVVPSFLSFSDIIGIGNDYIVIKSVGNIKKAYDDKNIMDKESLLLTSTTVLSSSGDIIGKISDYLIDEKKGEIEKLILDNNQEIDGSKLLTLSNKFVLANIDGNEVKLENIAAEADEKKLDEGSMSYLIGKTVNADIASEDGEFTVAMGTVLTKEIITQAAKHDALLLLTMEV